MAQKKPSFRTRLEDVARKGLDAMEDLLDTPIGAEKNHFTRAHLRAKIGANAVSNYVRNFSAENQREMVRLQMARLELVGEERDQTAPALLSATGSKS